jgi:hypothetical protein
MRFTLRQGHRSPFNRIPLVIYTRRPGSSPGLKIALAIRAFHFQRLLFAVFFKQYTSSVYVAEWR